MLEYIFSWFVTEMYDIALGKNRYQVHIFEVRNFFYFSVKIHFVGTHNICVGAE